MNKVYSKNNIMRAWLWLKTNPDRRIKDEYHMRAAYSAFTVVEDEFLSGITKELKDETYQPSIAEKFLLPKPSGGLRPYTLLTIKDQLVYQAIANIIAEKFPKKIQGRYLKKTFGNLYAGKNSPWFYRQWKDGYSAFNKSARTAFKSDKVFMASFDLVACFDTLDHKVLAHYLKKINIPQDIIDLLLKCLSKWTSADVENPIYQGHGIPQGPLSSGLIAEVVLQAFDDEKSIAGVSYMRYVDDIWFFAKNKHDLRSELVKMDKVCKKVGLFPQSSKINLRKVSDIELELKSVSGIFEEELDKYKKADYMGAILNITKDFHIQDITKFRYCIAFAKPNAKLINRLWKIFKNRPDTYPQICKTILRSGKLIKSSQENILEILKKTNPYTEIHASFIKLLIDLDLNENEAKPYIDIIKNKHNLGKEMRRRDPKLSLVIFQILYKYNRVTESVIKYMCASPFWFTRREIAYTLKNKDSKLLKNYLKDDILDVKISAADCIVSRDIQIPSTTAKIINSFFAEYGLVIGSSEVECRIDNILSEMLGKKFNTNWHNFFGDDYNHALRILVTCQSSIDTNASAWICQLDSFNDVLIRKLCLVDQKLPQDFKDIGGILGSKNSYFSRTYKGIHGSCYDIHNRRKTTITAHAYQRNGDKTIKFKHSEIKTYMKKQKELIESILADFPL
jgi:hypothetical protein